MRKEIEVAVFKSTVSDVQEQWKNPEREDCRKGMAAWSHITWVRREERRDCHRRMECYLIYEICIFGDGASCRFFFRKIEILNQCQGGK